MLEIGQHQLLMLLLVMQSEAHDLRGPQALHGRQVAPAPEPGDRGIDVRPILEHLGSRGPREHASKRAGMSFTGGVVVRVEQVPEGRMEGAVRRLEGREHEGLEEPGRVGEMPFERAGVGHRLRDEIFGVEMGAERFAARAHPRVVFEERPARCGGRPLSMKRAPPLHRDRLDATRFAHGRLLGEGWLLRSGDEVGRRRSSRSASVGKDAKSAVGSMPAVTEDVTRGCRAATRAGYGPAACRFCGSR